jgi:DNA mismatch repair protein MSH6
MPLPSAKPKPQEQKDPKKQKSLLGWLSKPADAEVANSSSAVRNAPVPSSSPSGRESIFETPSTKKRTTFGADAPVVRSATFTKSSDGGTSFNETPPTSDPIDVDMSSDEDVPGCGIKSVCGICTYASTSIGDHDLCQRLAQSGKSLSRIRMKGKLTTILLLPKGMVHPHIGLLKNLVR